MSSVRRAAGSVVLLAVLAATACSAEPPDPAPAPTPAPSVSQSPTETPQERQERLDYAAAEKAYRTFRAEYERVLAAGGANSPTAVMRAHASGAYLRELSEIAEAYKGLGLHSEGNEKIVYVRPAGHSSTEVNLSVCEDSRSVKDINDNGKVEGRGELRTATIEVRKINKTWKLWSGKGKRVGECA